MPSTPNDSTTYITVTKLLLTLDAGALVLLTSFLGAQPPAPGVKFYFLTAINLFFVGFLVLLIDLLFHTRLYSHPTYFEDSPRLTRLLSLTLRTLSSMLFAGGMVFAWYTAVVIIHSWPD